jgi:hypothetical protein
MKSMSFLKTAFFSTWFQALVPAVLLMLLLPPLSSKYKFLMSKSGKGKNADFYIDLNSDSTTEIIRPGKGEPYYYLLILDNDGFVYNQWNFKDTLNPLLSVPFSGNFDNDHFKELYIFSYRNDSVFLNINEFFDPDGIKKNHIFITRVGIVNKEITSTVFPAGFYDTNGDGYKELYFSINTGFGLTPRAIYCYDLHDNKLKTGALTGVALINPEMCDIDGDGRPEIFGNVSASDNNPEGIPFNDKSTWLLVYDDKLEFKFKPVEFRGLTNWLAIYPDTVGKSRSYFLLHTTGTVDTTVLKPRIMEFSSAGEKIRERPFSDFGAGKNMWAIVFAENGHEKFFAVSSELLEFNNELQILHKTSLPFHSDAIAYVVDIMSDGSKYLLLYSEEEEKLLVYDTAMHKIGSANIQFTPLLTRFSTAVLKNHEHKLYMSTNESGYFIELAENKYYFLSYLAYPGIYLLLILFIIIIKRINTYQVVQKESLNRRLVTLQLQGIKSQLDPHFTFNTLNSIASLVYLEDRQLAYDYLNKFTQLLRGLINDAERIYRSLGEELEFVTTYLELEKLRFGDRFNYEITINDGVSQREQVPKLVLHTFAENAIKHGIMSKPEGGTLKINASRNKEYMVLSIEDNGIGRARAEGQSSSTGKGLKLTGEFYDILNQINKRPIKHFIIDLHNATGESVGTKVEVWVPVN